MDRRIFNGLTLAFAVGYSPLPAKPKEKGLGNVIISTSLQSVYDVQIGVVGSQQNNRNSGYVFLDLPEQLKPTAIRQIDIQQDQGLDVKNESAFWKVKLSKNCDFGYYCVGTKAVISLP